MSRYGKLQVTVTFSAGSSSIKTYDMVEQSFGNQVVVGYSLVGATSPTVTWKYDLDVSDTTQLDAVFNQMGTNTYVWVEPMAKMPNDVSVPIAIVNGNNLNTFTEAGMYFKTASNASGCIVTNVPDNITGTFVLEVMKAGATDQVIQRLTVCDKAIGKAYQRTCYAGTWGEWQIIYMSGQKVLWTGAHSMNASQSIVLSDTVKHQENGIILVFSAYENGAASDSSWHYKFVPKYHVENHHGNGVSVNFQSPNFSKVGAKYLYISDDRITGHAENTGTGTTASGITRSNNFWVMRYVLGC